MQQPSLAVERRARARRPRRPQPQRARARGTRLRPPRLALIETNTMQGIGSEHGVSRFRTRQRPNFQAVSRRPYLGLAGSGTNRAVLPVHCPRPQPHPRPIPGKSLQAPGPATAVLQVHVHSGKLLPNPSLERTPTGRPPWPRSGQWHHPLRGQGALPAVAAQLKR